MAGNQGPGLITGKAGSDVELAAFNSHWEADEPTVLTGLTNVIRLGDLLVANGTTLTVIEVKSDPTRKKKTQFERLERLVSQLNDLPRLDRPDGPTWILESSVPMATHWSEATPHLERALQDGVAVWSPSDCVSVSLSAPLRASAKLADLDFRERATQGLAEAEATAAIGGGDHHVVVLNSLSHPYALQARVAPMSIFPIRPELAAMLITGGIFFTVRINVDRLAERLRAFGVDAKVALTTEMPALDANTPLLVHPLDGGGRRTIRSGVVQELGIELVDLDRWCEAVVQAPQPQEITKRFHTHICLANEEEAWA
jgi:hypothetical protein